MIFNSKPWFVQEVLISIFKKYITNGSLIKKNFMTPFYGWGSTAARLEPLQGGSLLFTTKFQEIPGTHFIDLRRMKGWVDLGANQALAWHAGDSPYPHYHPCKSRKRRLRQAMKSPSKGKAAWANISSSSRINFNWFNIRLILLTLDFKSLIFKTNLNCSYILLLVIVSITTQWASVNMLYQKR